jgi:indoleamine 2,3-dioxygenase
VINLSLAQFDIDSQRGFLPAKNPLTKLPAFYNPWEELTLNLNKLLIIEKVKEEIAKLPLLDIDKLKDEYEINRAMLLLSYMGHAFVWGGKKIVDTVPATIAVPWYEVAKILGRPPVLSYASHSLYNWKLYNEEEYITLENLIRLENFYGGIDEDWFVLIHIGIEAQSASGLQAILNALNAVANQNNNELLQALKNMEITLDAINGILQRMTEKCDPYIYYNRVRNFIFGWMNNPELPNGVFYEGVKEWKGQGQKFRGETGAQSSIIPSFDAALGLQFDTTSVLYKHLLGLREYMPPKHRHFIETIEELEKTYSIRQYIMKNNENTNLVDVYNACLDGIHLFRNTHLNYALNYINKQTERKGSPVDTGTGGTPLVNYLKQHVDDVLNSKISLAKG